MSLTMRLKRLGTKKKPHSRIIVCEKASGRDSREVDKVGYYDPTKNPPFIKPWEAWVFSENFITCPFCTTMSPNLEGGLTAVNVPIFRCLR